MEAGPPDEGQQPHIDIVIEPAQQAGVWANLASITPSLHEFTLDFIRLDHSSSQPGGPPTRGIVVARVAFSPLLASQLADILMEAWQGYARRELLEGQDDDQPEEPPEAPEA